MEAKRGQEWRRRKRHQWDKWMMFQWYEVFISTYRFLTERNMDGGVAGGSEAPFSHNCQPLPARLSFLWGTGDVRVFYLSQNQNSFFYPKSAWLKLHASDYEFWENNERRPQRSLSKPRGRQVSLQFRAYTFFGWGKGRCLFQQLLILIIGRCRGGERASLKKGPRRVLVSVPEQQQPDFSFWTQGCRYMSTNFFSVWENSRVKSIGIIQTFVLSSRHSTLQKSLSGSTTTRTPSMGKKRTLTFRTVWSTVRSWRWSLTRLLDPRLSWSARS